jgi:ferrochelatase
VAHHYELFDGVSPLNEQNRALMAALQTELAAQGPQLPVYLGNRNWRPFLTGALRQMAGDGVKNALALFTSAYSSYSSCRQYLEDITRAQAEVGPDAPQVHKLRAYYNHPGFIEPNIEHVQAALNQIPAERRASTHIAFTAHSIPMTMARNSDYEVQLQEVARLVAGGVNHPHWKLVYQSRSGPPHQPWLEPDIGDHLQALKAEGVEDVVIAPIGFISDHMEVIYDLDTEAKELSEEINLNVIRANTVGTHPTFVKMIRELIVERMTPNPVCRYLGTRGPGYDVCPANCCLPG